MTDVFGNLLRRAHGETGLTPALPSRFEPVEPAGEDWGKIEEVVPARDLHRRGIDPSNRERAHTPLAPTPTRQEFIPSPPIEHGVDLIRQPSSPRSAGAEHRDGPGEVAAVAPLAIDIAAIVAEALQRHHRSQPPSRPAVVSVSDDMRPPIVRTEPVASSAPVPQAATELHAPTVIQPAIAERAPAPPAIEVRIGRIEVAAVPPPPRAASAPVAPRTRPVSLSLREYLARRSRR